MSREPVKLQTSSESLLDAIALLGLEEHMLWQLADEELIQAEEELWKQDPAIWAEIQQARTAYQTEDDLAVDQLP